MSTMRERPNGLPPAPLKPRLAANIASPRSTPPPRLTARSQDSSASPANSATARKPLVATTTANARQSPATPSTISSKSATSATPTTKPLLRAARPGLKHLSSTASNSNLRAAAASTPNATPPIANKALRKAPSTYFSPTSARLQTAPAPAPTIRPPLTKNGSSFVYANGEVDDEQPTKGRGSDAQSVHSQSTDRSTGFVFANGGHNGAPARTQVASPLLSPLAMPQAVRPVPALLSPAQIFETPSSKPAPIEVISDAPTVAGKQISISQPQANPALLPKPAEPRKAITPVQQIARSPSPTTSETSVQDSTPHVIRSKITVDFPSKLPSPARRSSVDIGRRTSLTSSPMSPGHRKIQSVSSTAQAPSRLSRIRTNSESTVTTPLKENSPVISRLPRPSIDGGLPGDAGAKATIAEEPPTPGSTTQAESETSGTTNTVGAARHERKLLDLEISNSSLLAINRSLEREVLKQKAELRRMRRTTRATSMNNRVSWLSEVSTIDETSFDMGDSSPPGPDSIDMSFAEDADTPTRAYGQARVSSMKLDSALHLDLAKHKDILIDSQKMNLTIQRCLGMTEQLLKDAGSALEYQPTILNRVLTPEEQEQARDVESQGGGYFARDWAWDSPAKRDEMNRQQQSEGHDNATDKDSGVDLDESSLIHRLDQRDMAHDASGLEDEV